MNRISDEKLEKLLSDYYDSEPPVTLVFRKESDRVPAVVPIARYKRIAATAASLVLVTLLSLAIYFFSENKIDHSMLPVTSPQSTAPSEQGRGYGSDTDDGAPPDGTLPVPENDTVRQLRDGVISPVDGQGNDSAASSTPQGTVKPSASGSQQGSGTSDNGAKPVSPSATESPAKPSVTDPTAAPVTPSPTRPPHVPPTESHHHFPPPWEPVEPTASGDDPHDPIEYPTQPEPKNYCYGYFDYVGGDLYCWIEDENGNRMGDSDLFSAEHLAEIIYCYDNGYVLARWSPNEHGIRPSRGYHRYGFVDEHGNTQFEDYVHAQGVY